jgi:hypothetical protein
VRRQIGVRAVIVAVTLALACACSMRIPAQVSPAGAPDRPAVHIDGARGGVLENGRIRVSWTLRESAPIASQLRGTRIAQLRMTDKSAQTGPGSHDSLALDPPFSIELGNTGVLHASDLILSGSPRVEDLTPDPSASRFSDRLPGIAVHFALSDPSGRFTADWALILRDGSHYIRQQLAFTAAAQPLALAGIRLIDVRAPGVELAGRVRGSPLVAGNFFLGFESPLSQSSVVGDRGISELEIGVPIPAGQSATYSSVIGVAAPGQMRRAFLSYLERERAHPYRTFLHYNSWFDIGYGQPYTQQQALTRIHEIGEELNKKRGVTLDSYLFDDGWDDVNDLWKIRPDFKDGFAPLAQAAAQYGAAPGVWLSPWGGYDVAKQQRLATARRDGYEIVNNGLALSGPRYYKLFHDAVTGMVTKYDVNQFKFDGTGNVNQVVPGSAFSSDFDAAIHLIGDLRRIKPDLYINLTSGTWPSPFWLFYADSIWRGGDDTDFAGVGTDRQRWITYRDAETYEHVVEGGRLYPLNSLMLHGIVFAQQAPQLSTASDADFADEVHSYFGSGTQLQELYITPSLLSTADWDVLAATAKWSRSNAATLVDTHWIGGDPAWLEVYGWAAWSRENGILTLRNPAAAPQDFTVDVAQAFELPAGAPQHYVAIIPWSSDKNPDVDLVAGKPHTFHLAPFEVITLEATPQP